MASIIYRGGTGVGLSQKGLLTCRVLLGYKFNCSAKCYRKQIAVECNSSWNAIRSTSTQSQLKTSCNNKMAGPDGRFIFELEEAVDDFVMYARKQLQYISVCKTHREAVGKALDKCTAELADLRKVFSSLDNVSRQDRASVCKGYLIVLADSIDKAHNICKEHLDDKDTFQNLVNVIEEKLVALSREIDWMMIELRNSEESSSILKKVLPAVVVGGAAVVAAPLVIGAMGFGAGGIVAGSIAAKMMSAAAIANGGGVAAGSLVAVLQSAGAVGLTAGANAAIFGAFAGVTATVQAVGSKIKNLFSSKK